VTLSLHPKKTTVLEMQTVPYQDGKFGKELVVQKPKVGVSEFATTVSVPDLATVVAYGLRGSIEEKENNQMQDLLLLVKPTIIIQREQEERELPFPMLKKRAAE
jgi:hypothetical protein